MTGYVVAQTWRIVRGQKEKARDHPTPPKRDTWRRMHRDYLLDHGLDLSFVRGVENAYPCPEGLCFVATDGRGQHVHHVRLLCPSANRKSLNPHGMARDVLFVPSHPGWEGHEVGFVVEGPADALAIGQEGFWACATLGNILTPEKIDRIVKLRAHLKFSRLVFVPDADHAGVIQMHTLLTTACTEVRLLPLQYKDICTVPRGLRAKLVRMWADNLW